MLGGVVGGAVVGGDDFMFSLGKSGGGAGCVAIGGDGDGGERAGSDEEADGAAGDGGGGEDVGHDDAGGIGDEGLGIGEVMARESGAAWRRW